MGDRYQPDPRSGRTQYSRGGRNNSYFEQKYRNVRERAPSPRSDRFEWDRRYGRQDNEYTFRGAADRDNYRAERPQDTFSFRASGPPAPRFPSPERRPFQGQQPNRPDGTRRDQGKRGPTAQRGDRANGGRGRGRFVPRPAHTRDILQRFRRGGTPDQLEGMNANGQVHFTALESTDEEMGDDYDPANLSEDANNEDEPRKRAKTEHIAPEPVLPKWSNPDPYTSLPPPETLGAPKKDIVQVIRKAKVDSGPNVASTSAVKNNVDFISLNFDDDFEEGQVSEGSDSPRDHPVPSHAPVAPSSIPPWQLHPAIQIGNQTLYQIDAPRNKSIRMAEYHPPPPGVTMNLQQSKQAYPLGPPPPPPPGLVMPTEEEIVATMPAKGKKRKRGEQSRGDGDVLPEWMAIDADPTPWFNRDHSRTASAKSRLHEEILDFFDFIRPYDHETAIRQDLINRVQRTIRDFNNGMNSAKDVELKCFGSFAAGLFLPTADMDLVAVSPQFLQGGAKLFCQTNKQLHKLSAYLAHSPVAVLGTVSPVAHAKVPIVKFVEKQTGIKVDVSFENDTGLIANHTFQEWKSKYPAMPVLVVLVKQLLAMRGLNEVFTGGLGGFSIICLVVSMLQMMPESEWSNMHRQEHYADLLLRFLDLYGNKFDTTRTGILMNPPGYYDKVMRPMKKQNPTNLTIIDPNNPANDISGGSRNIGQVLACFRSAYAAIQHRMSQVSNRQDDESILGCVLGGNYSSFYEQRSRLRQLHQGNAVIPVPAPKPKRQRTQGKSTEKTVGTGEQNQTYPNPQRGHKTVTKPSQPEKKATKKAKQAAAEIQRAAAFKRLHPDISGVKEKLTKNELKQLKDKHKLF